MPRAPAARRCPTWPLTRPPFCHPRRHRRSPVHKQAHRIVTELLHTGDPAARSRGPGTLAAGVRSMAGRSRELGAVGGRSYPGAGRGQRPRHSCLCRGEWLGDRRDRANTARRDGSTGASSPTSCSTSAAMITGAGTPACADSSTAPRGPGIAGASRQPRPTEVRRGGA